MSEEIKEPFTLYSIFEEFREELKDEKYKETLTNKYIMPLFGELIVQCNQNTQEIFARHMNVSEEIDYSNKILKKDIKGLHELIGITAKSLKTEYDRGFHNGLICAAANLGLISEEEYQARLVK